MIRLDFRSRSWTKKSDSDSTQKLPTTQPWPSCPEISTPSFISILRPKSSYVVVNFILARILCVTMTTVFSFTHLQLHLVSFCCKPGLRLTDRCLSVEMQNTSYLNLEEWHKKKVRRKPQVEKVVFSHSKVACFDVKQKSVNETQRRQITKLVSCACITGHMIRRLVQRRAFHLMNLLTFKNLWNVLHSVRDFCLVVYEWSALMTSFEIYIKTIGLHDSENQRHFEKKTFCRSMLIKLKWVLKIN